MPSCRRRRRASRGCRRAGSAEFGPGFLAEPSELIGLPADRLGVALQPSGCGDFVLPAEPDVERAFADEFLRRVAATVAGDVARADGDEVWRHAELVAQLGDAGRPEQVDLDRPVERRVERNGGGRVNDDVGGRPDRPVLAGEAEPVGADVAGHGVDATCGHLVERLGRVGCGVGVAQPVEGVVLQQLLLDPLRCGRALTVADQEDQFAPGHAAQKSLDERGADEPGRAGDGDALASERLGDHNGHVYQMVETDSMVDAMVTG